MRSFLALCLFALSPLAWSQVTASANLKELSIEPKALAADLKLIETEGQLKPGTLTLDDLKIGTSNSVSIKCQGPVLRFAVTSTPAEFSATLYKGVREVGFLFPHPRWQITPTPAQMQKACGKTYSWAPTL